jgi:hypothetical protein
MPLLWKGSNDTFKVISSSSLVENILDCFPFEIGLQLTTTRTALKLTDQLIFSSNKKRSELHHDYSRRYNQILRVPRHETVYANNHESLASINLKYAYKMLFDCSGGDPEEIGNDGIHFIEESVLFQATERY